MPSGRTGAPGSLPLVAGRWPCRLGPAAVHTAVVVTDLRLVTGTVYPVIVVSCPDIRMGQGVCFVCLVERADPGWSSDRRYTRAVRQLGCRDADPVWGGAGMVRSRGVVYVVMSSREKRSASLPTAHSVITLAMSCLGFPVRHCERPFQTRRPHVEPPMPARPDSRSHSGHPRLGLGEREEKGQK